MKRPEIIMTSLQTVGLGHLVAQPWTSLDSTSENFSGLNEF